MNKKKLVILSGAGISKESGLDTFRDADGLWNGYDIMQVASIEGWHKDPALVLQFYNMRRKQALEAIPNQAHQICKALEVHFDVKIITQNVDTLHEKAGSKHVVHLHGRLDQAKSEIDDSYVVDWDAWELTLGQLCPKGGQLRPHIVWFGEAVPMIEEAQKIVATADIFVIVGTSLAVYPAAGLQNFVPPNAQKFIVDPSAEELPVASNFKKIPLVATEGMKVLEAHLLAL